jgi:hypothetical protein
MKCIVWIVLVMLLPLGWSAAQEMTTDPDGYVLLADARIRLRDAPSLQSNTLEYLEPRAPLSITGRTTDRAWLQVRGETGVVGWVWGELVESRLELGDVPVVTVLNLPAPEYALPDAVQEQVRTIYALGQANGMQPDVFAKLGDSLTAASHAYQPLADTAYNLDNFQYLQAVIDRFGNGEARPDESSFMYTSVGAGSGWTTDALLSPEFADPAVCAAGETPLVCEYRLTRPSIALILFGSNDAAHLSAATYGYNLRLIIEYSLEQGVIPVISTVPQRIGYEAEVAALNEKVLLLARRFHIPLWDYAAAMQVLPDYGLAPDGVHPSIPPRGYAGAADFRAANLSYGYVIRNLTALQVLESVLRALETE